MQRWKRKQLTSFSISLLAQLWLWWKAIKVLFTFSRSLFIGFQCQCGIDSQEEKGLKTFCISNVVSILIQANHRFERIFSSLKFPINYAHDSTKLQSRNNVESKWISPKPNKCQLPMYLVTLKYFATHESILNASHFANVKTIRRSRWHNQQQRMPYNKWRQSTFWNAIVWECSVLIAEHFSPRGIVVGAGEPGSVNG